MSQELQLREVVFTCYKSVKVTHNIAIDIKRYTYSKNPRQICGIDVFNPNVNSHSLRK